MINKVVDLFAGLGKRSHVEWVEVSNNLLYDFPWNEDERDGHG